MLQPPQLPVAGEIISFLWWSTDGHANEVYLFVRFACTTVNPKLYLTHDAYKQLLHVIFKAQSAEVCPLKAHFTDRHQQTHLLDFSE